MSINQTEVQSAIASAQAKAEAAAAEAFLIAFTEALVNTVSALDVIDAEEEPEPTVFFRKGDRVRVSEDPTFNEGRRDDLTRRIAGKVAVVEVEADSEGDLFLNAEGVSSYVHVDCVTLEPPVRGGDYVRVTAERPYWTIDGVKKFHADFHNASARPGQGDTGELTDEYGYLGLNGYLIDPDCVERIEA